MYTVCCCSKCFFVVLSVCVVALSVVLSVVLLLRVFVLVNVGVVGCMFGWVLVARLLSKLLTYPGFLQSEHQPINWKSADLSDLQCWVISGRALTPSWHHILGPQTPDTVPLNIHPRPCSVEVGRRRTTRASISNERVGKTSAQDNPG